MIKRHLAIAITVFIMLVGVFALSACDDDKYEKHTHTFGEWSGDSATCTAGGVRKRECTKCGFAEKKVTSPLGHDEVAHAAKAPTCAEAGWSAYVTCTRCMYTTYKELSALHELGELIAEIPATCEKAGQLAHYYCAECDKYYGVDKKELSNLVISATGHNISGGVCTSCASQGLKYKSIENGNAYAVIGIGSCKDSSIIIPSVYNGKPVTVIESRAFENYISLVSITVPESVTAISTNAFSGCYNLAEVINKSALEIKKGESEFGGIALYAQEVHGGDSGIGRLDNFTFYTDTEGKSYLVNYLGTNESLILPAYYNGEEYTVGAYAFYNNKTLRSVVISDGAVGIGKYAFGGCNKLSSITVGSSVEVVGTGAFDKCTALKSVYIKDVLSWCNIVAEDGTQPIFPSATKLYLNGKLVTELIIPDGVTKINDYAFTAFADIVSAVIPDSVTRIGDSAFLDCTGLASITIGAGLEYIGESAFSGCKSLLEISLPKTVLYIGENAFYYCVSLTSVNIEDIAAWCAIEFGNYSSNPIRYSEKLYLDGELLTDIELPAGITEISDYAFYYCKSIINVIIPEGVTGIGYQAFYECDGLSDIDIPASVEEISNYAFYNCTRLERIGFSDSSSLISIGESAFKYCTSLLEIELPDSVRVLGDSAFASCTLLGTAVLSDGLTALGNYAFSGCKSLSDIVLGSSLETVGAYAFYQCAVLGSVTVGEGVTTIGEYAFSGCEALEALVIPDSVKAVGDKAFDGCTALKKVTMPTLAIPHIPKDSLYTVVLTSGDTIKASAFKDVSTLVSVTLPESLKEIGEKSFTGCYKLVEVVNNSPLIITRGTEDYGSVAYNAIEVHSGESRLSVSEGYIFYTLASANYLVGCVLDGEALVLPESYNGSAYSIHKYAFNNCRSVKSIVIPAAASISEYAFINCTGLERLYVTKGVDAIPRNAFLGCTALTDVYYTGTAAEWNAININAEGNAFINNAQKHFEYK